MEALLAKTSKDLGLELLELRHGTDRSRLLQVLLMRPDESGSIQGALRACALPVEVSRVVVAVKFASAGGRLSPLSISIELESNPLDWLPMPSPKAERWIDASTNAFDVWEIAIPTSNGSSTINASMNEVYHVAPFTIRAIPREGGTPSVSDTNAKGPP